MISGIPRWLAAGATAAPVAGHGQLAHALDCGPVTAALAVIAAIVGAARGKWHGNRLRAMAGS